MLQSMESCSREGCRSVWLGALLVLLLAASVGWSLFGVTSEGHQGDVYRILYLHVPSAFTAFASSLLLFFFSVKGLSKTPGRTLLYGKATAEVGLLFTAVTLMTGSIWGKPTWGVWWTWDARLTTTFILALLYCGYLLLWSAVSSRRLRTKVVSVLGILIFADVPIIYKSVSWWRTLHQPPSLLREGGPTMAPEIATHLLLSIGVVVGVGAWLVWQRAKNLRLAEELESLSYAKMDG